MRQPVRIRKQRTQDDEDPAARGRARLGMSTAKDKEDAEAALMFREQFVDLELVGEYGLVGVRKILLPFAKYEQEAVCSPPETRKPPSPTNWWPRPFPKATCAASRPF